MKKSAQTSGFTIVELIVVVAIIALLFGTGITAFNDFNRRQLVVQTAKNIKNELRIAQNKAITGEKDCSVGGVCGGVNGKCQVTSRSLDGWFVDFNINQSYQIYGKCQGVSTTFGVATFTVPASITLSTPSPNFIQFYPLTSGAMASYICISGFNNKYKYKISITTAGEIKDEGIKVNCP